MTAGSLIEVVTQRLPDAIASSHTWRGDETLVVHPKSLVEVAQLLRDEPSLQMGFLMDLTAVDYSAFADGATPAFFRSSGVTVKPVVGVQDENPWCGPPETRFAVVYHFYSPQHKHRMVPVRSNCVCNRHNTFSGISEVARVQGILVSEELQSPR